jgi:hypothetical protein
MKNKSFLFLIAALALGLAFASCCGDTETNTVPGPKEGYASQITAINAAFTDGASTVKLVGPTSFVEDDDPLIIPGGRTLDLAGYTLSDTTAKGIIVVGADGNIIGFNDTNGKVELTKESYFLSNEAFKTANVGTTGQGKGVTLLNPGSISVLDAKTNLGYVVSFTSKPTETADPRLAAISAGSMGIVLFNLSLDEPFNIGVGQLYVNGDLTLTATGTVSGAGTLTVSKAVNTSGITSGDIVGGELKAKSLNSGGGKFGGTVTLSGGNAISNVLAGSFAGGLTSSGAATLKGNVYFALPSTIEGAVTVNDNDINLWGEGGLTVAGATVGKKLTIGGTLTTNGNVTLGSGNTGSIVLDAKGGFEISGDATFTAGNAYTLAGAGSISNGLDNPGVGSLITLNATGITSAGGTAGGTPTLVFSDSILLDFLKDATIADLALDVNGGGTITVGAGTSAATTLSLTGAGSIVAANIAYPKNAGSTAVIKSVTGYAGTLIGGTAAEASVLAGSVGTVGNLITKEMGFVVVGTLSSFGDVTLSAGGGTGVALTEGSVAVFSNTP